MKMMDDMNLTEVILKSKFNSYSMDGYGSREAERDICLYAKEYFKQTSTVFLQGLTATENTPDWIKRKQEYKPNIAELSKKIWKTNEQKFLIPM